jgi:hypothetical protein
MTWQSAGRSPDASRCITSGDSLKCEIPLRSVSRAGSCSRSGASPRRSVVVRVRRRQPKVVAGCRFEQHWLLIDDILADVKSDYTDADIKSSTVDGKIYQVKMVDDLGVLYYPQEQSGQGRCAAPDHHRRADRSLPGAQYEGPEGPVYRQRRRCDPVVRRRLPAGPILWTVGSDYQTADNKPGFTTPDVKQSFAKTRELFLSKSILLGAPYRWWDPSSFTQGLAAVQWCGLWAIPGIQKAIADDFGVVAWPAFRRSVGKPSTFLRGGARWSALCRPTLTPPRRTSSGCGSTTPRTIRGRHQPSLDAEDEQRVRGRGHRNRPQRWRHRREPSQGGEDGQRRASLVWKLSIFNGVRFGLANTVLNWFGEENIAWLATTDPPWYWLVIVTVRLWLHIGFYMILFLAGLQRISPKLYEAAALTAPATPGRRSATSHSRSCGRLRWRCCCCC